MTNAILKKEPFLLAKALTEKSTLIFKSACGNVYAYTEKDSTTLRQAVCVFIVTPEEKVSERIRIPITGLYRPNCMGVLMNYANFTEKDIVTISDLLLKKYTVKELAVRFSTEKAELEEIYSDLCEGIHLEDINSKRIHHNKATYLEMSVTDFKKFASAGEYGYSDKEIRKLLAEAGLLRSHNGGTNIHRHDIVLTVEGKKVRGVSIRLPEKEEQECAA